MAEIKQLGKLSEEQLKRLIRKLPEFRSESVALGEALRKAPGLDQIDCCCT